MKNQRLTNIKKILNRDGINYVISGCVITTEPKDEDTMRKIATKMFTYVPRSSIVYHIRQTESLSVNECYLKIDTGTEREVILKALAGIGYKESYGYFTTDAGKIYITDALDIAPETSFEDLSRQEAQLVDEFNQYIFKIRESNHTLRCTNVASPRYGNVLTARQGYIDSFERCQQCLIALRTEMREKYGTVVTE